MRKEKGEFNPQEWNEIYLAFSQNKAGAFFKRRALRASGFYSLVPDKKAQILDVGCGSGQLLIEWSRRGFSDLYGVEPDPELTRQIPATIHVETAPAQKLPFETGKFDVVFFYGVLHHIPRADWPLAFSEFDRVLKPGGLLFILEPGIAPVYHLMWAVSKIAGAIRRRWGIVAKSIDLEREEIFPFMRHYGFFEQKILDSDYKVLVNRRTPFVSPIVHWFMSCRKKVGSAEGDATL